MAEQSESKAYVFSSLSSVRQEIYRLSVYHGERARYHYFQCLQLLLRMQIAALTKIWKLPPEFEVRIIVIRVTVRESYILNRSFAGICGLCT